MIVSWKRTLSITCPSPLTMFFSSAMLPTAAFLNVTRSPLSCRPVCLRTNCASTLMPSYVSPLALFQSWLTSTPEPPLKVTAFEPAGTFCTG